MNVIRYIAASLSIIILSSCGGGGGGTAASTPVPGNQGIIYIETATQSTISIGWTKATDETSSQANLSYRVYYSTSNNISTVADCEANGTLALDWTADIDDVTVSGLAPHTTYYFNVVVVNEAGNKSAYAVAAAETLDIEGPTPGNEGLVAAHSDTATSVILSWTKASDDSTPQQHLEYKVVYSSSGNITTVDTAEANGTVAVDFTADIDTAHVTGLEPDTVYYFNVVVRDEVGKKNVYAMTSAETLHPEDPIPGDNGKITVSDIGLHSASLMWTKATDQFTPTAELEYRVYYSTSDNIRTVADCEANGTPAGDWQKDIASYEVTGLATSTTYYFNVIVRDGKGYMQPYVSTNARTTDFCTSTTKCIYLVSAPSGNLGGVSGADALCNASRPAGVSSAKAFIVNGSTRIACATPYCSSGGASEHKDWVLQPSTTYYRPDETPIDTTSSIGLLTVPLTNAFSDSNYEIWTGLYSYWLTSPAICNGWTSAASSGVYGYVGLTDATDYSAYAKYLQYCNRTYVRLACVQQD
jgi:hypothetical protein